MEDFRDVMRAVENTMAMSIGKFNFQSLKDADEMAAWIFFVFASKYNDFWSLNTFGRRNIRLNRL
jgi:hypothetical protein